MRPAGGGSLRRFGASPRWIALGVPLGLFAAAALLYPDLWRLAGLAAVVGAGLATAPLERGRRDHTVHSAFVA
jgi:hypothetical protein